MDNCSHDYIIGDNYGQTCQTCGKIVAGFGYGGWFGSRLTGTTQCIHLWQPLGDDKAKFEICMYCEQERAKQSLDTGAE